MQWNLAPPSDPLWGETKRRQSARGNHGAAVIPKQSLGWTGPSVTTVKFFASAESSSSHPEPAS